MGLEADKWRVILFVDNAFDDDTVKSGDEPPDFSSPFDGPAPAFVTLGMQPDKRQVGVRVKYDF